MSFGNFGNQLGTWGVPQQQQQQPANQNQGFIMGGTGTNQNPGQDAWSGQLN